MFRSLVTLKREAHRHGVTMMVDDEFDRLSQDPAALDVIDFDYLCIRHLLRPSGVFRLLPNGQCNVGVELLQAVTPDTPRWVPGEMHAGDFINMLRERHTAKMAMIGDAPA